MREEIITCRVPSVSPVMTVAVWRRRRRGRGRRRRRRRRRGRGREEEGEGGGKEGKSQGGEEE